VTRLFLAALIVSAAMPVAAQTLPQSSANPLQEICSGFLEQSGQGISGDQAKLCACLVTQVQAGLTRAEMEAYAAATQNGQQPPPAVMQKVVSIATQCLTASAR